MELAFTVQMKIQKPVGLVFDAVYYPNHLSAYFANGGASAPLKEGTTVEWRFADNLDKIPVIAPVNVKKVIPNKQIVLSWEGVKGLFTQVTIDFEKIHPEEAVVKISETGWRETQNDLKHSYLNCEGWTAMLCFLKAYLEHGISLRQGAYAGLY